MTPMASPYTGTSMRGASHRQAAIMDRFSSTGVKAGTAKRRQVFSTPDAKAISDMHRMYGNITRVIQTAAPNSASRAAPRSPLAMADTTQGAATMPTSVTSISASVSSSATRSSSVRTSSSDRLLRAAPRIGTKACAKAPSANNRRSRFGMRKATQNASVMGPAPKARRHQDVTGQAGNAGQQREAADGGRGAEQTHFSYP